MPSRSPSGEDYYAEIRDEADDYAETVLTLLAFSAFVCHDGRARRTDSHFGFGRRMTTSSTNRVSASGEVTPDCVVQMSGDYGIVGEVKKSLPQDQSRWTRERAQLRKYDDSLLGWWTSSESIQASDVVMLIHISRGRAFSRFLDLSVAADPDSVGPHTSVIEFNRADEGQPYIFLRQARGALSHSALAARLDEGVQIPMERVKLSFPNVLYYDTKPPLEELMKSLWIDSFFSRFDPSGVDPTTGIAAIAVGVTEITAELQNAYGSGSLERDSRSTEFPKQSWVRDALEKFVQLGMASRGSGEDLYIIKYKILQQGVDALQYFCSLTFGSTPRLAVTGQLDLLVGSDDDSGGEE